MSQPTEEQIKEVLRRVNYPGYTRDIVSFGLVKGIKIEGEWVRVTLAFGTEDEAKQAMIAQKAREALLAVPGVREAVVEKTRRQPQAAAAPGGGGLEKKRLEGVDHIIAVASGKGGVGKSTVAVNLALALAEQGVKTGLLDADMYGPSMGVMLGIKERPRVSAQDKKLIPIEKHGLQVMSLAFLISEDTPVIWRGLMVMQVLNQFLHQVAWDCRVMVVDLPPGTGDTQLTLVQGTPLAGGVVVTTPQDIALEDARRALRMFQEVDVPVLGVIENMSGFECPHCHQTTDVFLRGGGAKIAGAYEVPLLGKIPLLPEIARGGDGGRPLMLASPKTAAAEVFREVAARLAERTFAAARS